MRVHLLALGLVAIGAIAAACGGETSTTYGPPDGLVNRPPPTPGPSNGSSSGGSGSSSGSSSTSSTSSGSTSSSGSSSGAGDGGNGSSGGEGGATGPCSVSWSTTIFPYFESTGSGTCGTTTCHGGTDAPTIVDGNPATTYTNLTTYTINGLHYIAAGQTNPAQSSIECNTGITTPVCGIAEMPEAPGVLSATARSNITTWLMCGAPNN
jgi:hypothetical protein